MMWALLAASLGLQVAACLAWSVSGAMAEAKDGGQRTVEAFGMCFGALSLIAMFFAGAGL